MDFTQITGEKTRVLKSIPAPGYRLTNGNKPRTGEAQLHVQFRNGYVDEKHTYTAKQIRWTDTGDSHDVVAVRRA